MMDKPDGGPAFPWGEHGTHLGGMTLRDYFAAKAMLGTLVGLSDEGSYTELRALAKVNSLTTEAAIARAAYTIADAMLTEREK